MIIVHHLNNSRSQRILWMLEELGVPYDVKRYQREPSMQAPASLRAVHPLGKSPVITDGDRTLAESGAILEYLEGSAMPPLLLKLIFDRTAKAAPLLVRPVARLIAEGVKRSFIEPNIERNLDYMEAEIGKSGWFAGGELTAADIQMSFPLEAAAARAPLVRQMPKLSGFLDRIQARPAYKRALEKGGPYELMK